MATKKRGLGKNFNALLFDTLGREDIPITPNPSTANAQHIHTLALTQLQPGKYQPRREMNAMDLEALADSVRAQGVIQPVIVRHVVDDSFEIIAGERRFRAAKLAGLESIPVVIRDVSDQTAMAMALIENIQREDLSPLEEAHAFERLAKEFTLTHAKVAEMVGKSRASVSNSVRLLNLNAELQSLLEQGDIEVGHAKLLLTLKDPLQAKIAKMVVEKGLSVRETERVIANLEPVRSNGSSSHKGKHLDPDIVRLQNSLSDKLGAPIQIVHSVQGKGKIVIHYSSLDELDGVLAHLDPTLA